MERTTHPSPQFTAIRTLQFRIRYHGARVRVQCAQLGIAVAVDTVCDTRCHNDTLRTIHSGKAE
jgi:hypothetical protein